ncbi:hypothetical protein CYFUS_002188 [Cystobacter fuscus]|uniref:Uncharacterized protein n=1 Tax=Cystobacter fuscus TaxID=43 RepID=A0A250IZP3_9BACT|nr:hypothetical protein CYFUS_002188 [Cystobacter fuscus]
MWRSVSQPEQQVGVSTVRITSGDDLFSAYTDTRNRRLTRRQLLTYGLGLAIFAVLAYVAVTFQPEATPFRVDTHQGMRTVLRGMTPQEVSGILGPPLGREKRGDQECFQYGRPSLKAASFILNTVCYVDGKLQSVSARRYNSWVVTHDGAIVPAPIEGEELVPPPEPGAPNLVEGAQP